MEKKIVLKRWNIERDREIEPVPLTSSLERRGFFSQLENVMSSVFEEDSNIDLKLDRESIEQLKSESSIELDSKKEQNTTIENRSTEEKLSTDSSSTANRSIVENEVEEELLEVEDTIVEEDSKEVEVEDTIVEEDSKEEDSEQYSDDESYIEEEYEDIELEKQSVYSEIRQTMEYQEFIKRSRDLKKIVFSVDHSIYDKLGIDSVEIKREVSEALKTEFNIEPEDCTINIKESQRAGRSNIFIEVVFSDGFTILQNEKIRQLLGINEKDFSQYLEGDRDLFRELSELLRKRLNMTMASKIDLEKLGDISEDQFNLFYSSKVALSSSLEAEEDIQLIKEVEDIEIDREKIEETIEDLRDIKEKMIEELIRKNMDGIDELISIEKKAPIDDSFFENDSIVLELKELIVKENRRLRELLEEKKGYPLEKILDTYNELLLEEEYILKEFISGIEDRGDIKKELEEEIEDYLSAKKEKLFNISLDSSTSDSEEKILKELEQFHEIEKKFIKELEQRLYRKSRMFLDNIENLLDRNLEAFQKYKSRVFDFDSSFFKTKSELKDIVEQRKMKERELGFIRSSLRLLSKIDDNVLGQYREFIENQNLNKFNFFTELFDEKKMDNENGDNPREIVNSLTSNIFALLDVRNYIMMIAKHAKTILLRDIKIWRDAYISYITEKKELKSELERLKSREEELKKEYEIEYRKQIHKNIYTFKMNFETISRSLFTNLEHLHIDSSDSERIVSISKKIRQSLNTLLELDRLSRYNIEKLERYSINDKDVVPLLEDFEKQYKELTQYISQIDELKNELKERLKQTLETLENKLLSSEDSSQLDLKEIKKQIKELEKEYQQLQKEESLKRGNLFLLDIFKKKSEKYSLKLLEKFFKDSKLDLSHYDALFSLFSVFSRINRVDRNGKTLLISEIKNRQKSFTRKILDSKKSLLESIVVEKLKTGENYRRVIHSLLDSVDLNRVRQTITQNKKNSINLLKFESDLDRLDRLYSLNLIDEHVKNFEDRKDILNRISNIKESLKSIKKPDRYITDLVEKIERLQSQLEKAESEIKLKIRKDRKVLESSVESLFNSFTKATYINNGLLKSSVNRIVRRLPEQLQKKFEVRKIEEDLKNSIKKMKEILGDRIEELDILGNVTEPLLYTLESLDHSLLASPGDSSLDTIYLLHYSRRTDRNLEERFRQIKRRLELFKEINSKRVLEREEKREVVEKREKSIGRVVQNSSFSGPDF